MGKCWSCLSSFRAQFRPNEGLDGGSIPLTPQKPPLPPPGPPTPPDEEKTPLAPDANKDAESDDSVLAILSLDLLVDQNGPTHHTDRYHAVHKQSPKLVIRRGQDFRLRLGLSRDYNAEKDALVFVFTVKDAPNPSYSQGTQVICPVLQDSEDDENWQAQVENKETKAVVVQVRPSSNAIVGDWRLEIDTKLKTAREADSKSLRYNVTEPLYILFNPWCETDNVYLEGEEKRKEYVLNDVGLIWRGTHSSLRPVMWNFGQFEENILECCVHLLKKVGSLSVVARADPIRVSRHISAVVNSVNDNGVLEGNWSGEYRGGRSPTQWTGSISILQDFFKHKKPVKFGQCWVFSGVCTTVCRTLGIPSRCITNFSSAHDTHNSLTIDIFYDGNGDPIERLNIDSIWNFHVWNEAWMTRPDLDSGEYSGWQAIDATPQEESDGLYRCGPTSLVAIKKGEVLRPYDTTFLFAEVNADKVYWRYHGPSQPLKLISKASDSIGQYISTKAVGQFAREDVTHNYKYDEGSREEREVMLKALRKSESAFSRFYLNEEMEDISFDFQLLDDIVIGSPFTVLLKASNKKSANRSYTIQIIVRLDTMLYTGRLKNLVKRDKFQITVDPGNDEVVEMKVTYEDYESSLVDQCAFNVSTMATVQETNFEYFAQDDFRVRMPDIKIEVEGPLVAGQEFTVTATFKNPIPKKLRNAGFYIEGPGLGEPFKTKLKKPVQPHEEVSVSCKMTPRFGGEKAIVAKFNSKDLNDIDGHKTIFVLSGPNDTMPDVTELNGDKPASDEP